MQPPRLRRRDGAIELAVEHQHRLVHPPDGLHRVGDAAHHALERNSLGQVAAGGEDDAFDARVVRRELHREERAEGIADEREARSIDAATLCQAVERGDRVGHGELPLGEDGERAQRREVANVAFALAVQREIDGQRGDAAFRERAPDRVRHAFLGRAQPVEKQSGRSSVGSGRKGEQPGDALARRRDFDRQS
jgi:hypothetical protein